MTPDSIMDAMKEIMDAPVKPQRQFVIQTGMGGMKAINNAIKDEVDEAMLTERRRLAKQVAHHCVQHDKLSFTQYVNILKMIDSPDKESITLAETMLESKVIELKDSGIELTLVSQPAQAPNETNQYASIYRGGSQVHVHGSLGQNNMAQCHVVCRDVQTTLRGGENSGESLKEKGLQMVRAGAVSDFGNLGGRKNPCDRPWNMVP